MTTNKSPLPSEAANARRMALLEGNIVGTSPSGRKMLEAGHSDVKLPLSFDTTLEAVMIYVLVVPAHTYAASIARHFAHPDRIHTIPKDLQQVLRIVIHQSKSRNNTVRIIARVRNLPDGDYVVAAGCLQGKATQRRPDASPPQLTSINVCQGVLQDTAPILET